MRGGGEGVPIGRKSKSNLVPFNGLSLSPPPRLCGGGFFNGGGRVKPQIQPTSVCIATGGAIGGPFCMDTYFNIRMHVQQYLLDNIHGVYTGYVNASYQETCGTYSPRIQRCRQHV